MAVLGLILNALQRRGSPNAARGWSMRCCLERKSSMWCQSVRSLESCQWCQPAIQAPFRAGTALELWMDLADTILKLLRLTPALAPVTAVPCTSWTHGPLAGPGTCEWTIVCLCVTIFTVNYCLLLYFSKKYYLKVLNWWEPHSFIEKKSSVLQVCSNVLQ